MSPKELKLPNYIGIASATLCAIHCLITPFLIVLVSNSEWWPTFSYLFLIISFYSTFKALQNSQNTIITILIVLSFLFFCFCVLFEETFSWAETGGYLASGGLVIGHIFNIKHCNNCKPKL